MRNISLGLLNLIVAAQRFGPSRFDRHPAVMQLALNAGNLLTNRLLLLIDLPQVNLDFRQFRIAGLLHPLFFFKQSLQLPNVLIAFVVDLFPVLPAFGVSYVLFGQTANFFLQHSDLAGNNRLFVFQLV